MMRSAAPLLTLMAGLLAITGCATPPPTQPVAAPPPSVSTVRQRVLTVCTDIPSEPFEFREGGREVGIDIDLMRAVAGEFGLEAAFRDTDFDTIFDAAVAGECDVVASAVSITPERQAKYLFTDGYFEIDQSLLVRGADAGTLATLEALTGKRIGVKKGTTGAEYARRRGEKATIVEFADQGELIAALERGAVDGVVQDLPINSFAARRNPSLAVVQTMADTEREQYGFALPQGREQLRDAINAALRRIRNDGRHDQILGRYLGTARRD